MIILYKTHLLSLLKALYGQVLIPEAVKKELLTKREGVHLLQANPWISVRVVEGELTKVLRVFLDEGEAEAISLAKTLDDILLIDERKGRKIAGELGVEIRGTLGLLVEAKRRGFINRVGDRLQEIMSKGYYIDEKLLELVLKEVGEEN
ncbi:DUF3368 domain-containing protein [Candidatus Pyrohabitans sp.]